MSAYSKIAVAIDLSSESAVIMERARGAMQRIVDDKLSKYNHAPLLEGALPGHRQKKVLVVDQTFGDSSVTCGMAGDATFGRMLAAALAENPEADIVIKVHPDVVAGLILADTRAGAVRRRVVGRPAPRSRRRRACRLMVMPSRSSSRSARPCSRNECRRFTPRPLSVRTVACCRSSTTWCGRRWGPCPPGSARPWNGPSGRR